MDYRHIFDFPSVPQSIPPILGIITIIVYIYRMSYGKTSVTKGLLIIAFVLFLLYYFYADYEDNE